MVRKNWIKILFTIIFLILTGFLLYSILFASTDTQNKSAGYFKEEFPYDLAHAAKKFFLPIELKEISGISYLKENTLVAIEDRHGIIYAIDYRTGRITERYEFGKDGDYEDITVVNNTVYVLRNSGKIFRISNLGPETKKDKKYKPDLDLVKNTEGLCYYAKLNALLITYKSLDINDRDFKADSDPGLAAGQDAKLIYAFDLATEKILPHPVLHLDFKAYRDISGIQVTSIGFKPSGIAIHPLTGHIYLLSSIAKQMLVIDTAGGLVFLVPLDSQIFRQPEGICFLPNGDMLISSEGRGGNGYYLHFLYNKAKTDK